MKSWVQFLDWVVFYLLGFPPTGKRLEFWYVFFIRNSTISALSLVFISIKLSSINFYMGHKYSKVWVQHSQNFGWFSKNKFQTIKNYLPIYIMPMFHIRRPLFLEISILYKRFNKENLSTSIFQFGEEKIELSESYKKLFLSPTFS